MNFDGKAVRMTVDHKGIDPEESMRVRYVYFTNLDVKEGKLYEAGLWDNWQ